MVYICVLNYNNANDTVDCLESLSLLEGNEYKIILIDNASTNGSDEVLRQYVDGKDKILFFPLKKNSGYAAGNNVGLSYALRQSDMEFCWILNNDTLVEPDSMNILIDYMRKHKDVGLCGSKLIYSWDRNRIQGIGGKYIPWLSISVPIKKEEKINDIDFVIGASVFVSRDFLESIGLMCEDYFLYYEEIDWALRAKGKYRISCEPKSIVYHKEGASIGTNAFNPKEKSAMADYFSMRNRLLFTYKFYPWYLPLVWFSSLFKIWNRFIRGDYERIWMIIKLMIGFRDLRFEPDK